MKLSNLFESNVDKLRLLKTASSTILHRELILEDGSDQQLDIVYAVEIFNRVRTASDPSSIFHSAILSPVLDVLSRVDIDDLDEELQHARELDDLAVMKDPVVVNYLRSLENLKQLRPAFFSRIENISDILHALNLLEEIAHLGWDHDDTAPEDVDFHRAQAKNVLRALGATAEPHK